MPRLSLARRAATLMACCLAAPALAGRLDLTTLDRSVEPCQDFYQFVCGGWQRNNPIPADESSWSVYQKLYEDNLNLLRRLLDDAEADPNADPVRRQIGSHYQACMDEATVGQRGLAPVAADLEAIARATSWGDLWPVVMRLQRGGGNGGTMFSLGATPDPDDARTQIAAFDQGGLGLPDRDYYLASDEKSVALRGRYFGHITRLLVLAGQSAESAARDAAAILRLETALARASLDVVARRDPRQVMGKFTSRQLARLAPRVPWADYSRLLGQTSLKQVNVGAPAFFAELSRRVEREPLAAWQAYLRFHLLTLRAQILPQAFVEEHFDFNGRALAGTPVLPQRWKRCVALVDEQLGEALGRVYVERYFPASTRQAVVDMVGNIEAAMAERIGGRPWMGEATRRAALAKLAAIRNKIGYPDHWRDYSAIRIDAGDLAGNVERAAAFEFDRRAAMIGRPVNPDEWHMTPPTVNAYFDPQMNDINFPAGILQPPLYDAALDDAPNYGNTGGTIGHELTHAFDDEGRQFDARGNLRDWWTRQDARRFAERTQCLIDQYGQYVAIDDIRVNSRLTVGEDVADLGGQVLAYAAWRRAQAAGGRQEAIDGFTPEQRFFIGFGQWACDNVRPEKARQLALTDPHSPARYRINGVVVNMPEFGRAFACPAGAPMTRPVGKACEVW